MMTNQIMRRLEKIEALMAPPRKFKFTVQFINPATHEVTRVLRIRSSESGIEQQWSRKMDTEVAAPLLKIDPRASEREVFGPERPF
jgi:hypothetical protein